MKNSGLAAAFGLVLAAAISWPSHAKSKIVKLEISDVPVGSIVIRSSEFKLYYVLSKTQAIAYPIAAPKPSMEWTGLRYIRTKLVRPAWQPPAVVSAAVPGVTSHASGSERNPMGAAAMELGDELAIHGTAAHMRRSIGTRASFGCIRMLNEDIEDLFARVSIGTPVYKFR